MTGVKHKCGLFYRDRTDLDDFRNLCLVDSGQIGLALGDFGSSSLWKKRVARKRFSVQVSKLSHLAGLFSVFQMSNRNISVQVNCCSVPR